MAGTKHACPPPVKGNWTFFDTTPAPAAEAGREAVDGEVHRPDEVAKRHDDHDEGPGDA